MADHEERLTERLMVQLSARDLRALQAIADEMERPPGAGRPSGRPAVHLSDPRGRGDPGRGDHIVEEKGREARERRKTEEQENGR
jgi:hypothetical protein